MSVTIDVVIRKHVLKNAFDYGKANAGAVVGKVIGEMPDCKKDMKLTMSKINAEISRVSKLAKADIEKEMGEFEYIEKKEEKKLIELPLATQGNVITRFPPEPSGYPHIGHAKAAWLDFESANTYGGKMILRFDDTNPEKESYEYVDAIKDGLKWLGISWVKETYTSDNMHAIYDAAKVLINADKAYVCTCSQEDISKGRTDGKACACRSATKTDALSKWDSMLKGKVKVGEAVLRFKGDLSAENTVMRDPTLARIITTKHYRQGDKYIVWPSYDLAVCVMDHLEGITHSMRSKEYELRDALSLEIYGALNWKPPQLIGFSRLNIKNAPISKRLLLPLVKDKKVMGWDDPRLPTLEGLKRRGVMPEAIKHFVLSFGLSKVESEPDWESLLAENRKVLDPISPHFFFVPNPVAVSVEGIPIQELELKLHPKQDLGTRKLTVSKTVYVPGEDAKQLSIGTTFRLKDLCNVKLSSASDVGSGKAFIGSVVPEGQVDKKLQWVGEAHLECDVLVPKDLLGADGEFDPNSLQTINGICERVCATLEIGTIVQFERFGFCRLDKKNKDGSIVFVYSC